MEVVKNVALISINATAVVQLVSFLIFMVLFNRVMVRPLRRVMTKRERFTEQMKEDIIAANAAYADIAQQIGVQEKDARKTASNMRDEIESEGRQSAGNVIEETRKEIDALKVAAWQEADTKIADARRQIEAESETLSDQMVNYLLERRSAV